MARAARLVRQDRSVAVVVPAQADVGVDGVGRGPDAAGAGAVGRGEAA